MLTNITIDIPTAIQGSNVAEPPSMVVQPHAETLAGEYFSNDIACRASTTTAAMDASPKPTRAKNENEAMLLFRMLRWMLRGSMQLLVKCRDFFRIDIFYGIHELCDSDVAVAFHECVHDVSRALRKKFAL
jgi:hypothetical protein